METSERLTAREIGSDCGTGPSVQMLAGTVPHVLGPTNYAFLQVLEV